MSIIIESILTNEEKEFIASLVSLERFDDGVVYDYELDNPFSSYDEDEYDRDTSNRIMEEYRKSVLIELLDNPFEYDEVNEMENSKMTTTLEAQDLAQAGKKQNVEDISLTNDDREYLLTLKAKKVDRSKLRI
ncbi:hypothetical protein [Pseudomonas haemolytica]|jgi:hypothetical protein|uniref:Uncharacterized protein n=1 Tax=Pseudomonas haemolytica TaxID=2600065 RepID=A0ABS1H0J4_9PSED|nr:hypothetical protein [Pseudomonas haemolytica]MBK3462645.1 hypothetical protein [Pseudomonas haemolytica]